jgi:hypothetical protein
MGNFREFVKRDCEFLTGFFAVINELSRRALTLLIIVQTFNPISSCYINHSVKNMCQKQTINLQTIFPLYWGVVYGLRQV